MISAHVAILNQAQLHAGAPSGFMVGARFALEQLSFLDYTTPSAIGPLPPCWPTQAMGLARPSLIKIFKTFVT